jgi:hypothetical protein
MAGYGKVMDDVDKGQKGSNKMRRVPPVDESSKSFYLGVDDYPGLKDFEEGKIVQGTVSLKMGKADKKRRQVSVEDLNLEMENSADQAMRKMMEQPGTSGRSVQGSPTMKDEDGDF